MAFVSGKPFIVRLMGGGLRKPKIQTPGNDFAGRVEAVGSGVTQFKVGDEVFGDTAECGFGTFAEYITVPENAVTLKPRNLTFEEAATVPEAALVALQGLRDKGEIQAGQKVLISGATGGIGTFAVQLAKHFGAEVTAVVSTRNVDMVRALGADHVIDYTREDFTRNGQQYDLILATVGERSIFDYKRALSPTGTYVATGGSLKQIFQAMLLGPMVAGSGRKMMNLLLKTNKDLAFIKELLEAGKIKPVIDRCYPLSEVPEALRYYATGRACGKVVISVQTEGRA
jgi:NADPH:quinone reductase-like Zn-dependent oxidoreductase